MRTYSFPPPGRLEPNWPRPRIKLGKIAGIWLIVDPEVPPNEVWAEGPDGVRHIITLGTDNANAHPPN